MTASIFFFLLLALAAVAAAVGMLLSQNAVYAALFLIVNFSTVAIIYLTLGAPFIALTQITVYAGAIMVLFLFVIMLLGAEKLRVGQSLPWQRPVGIILGLLLLVETVYLIVGQSGVNAPLSIPSADFASPEAIGMALFQGYLLPFEVTSVLLLVALIGAIVLTRTEKRAAGRRLISLETRAAGKPDEQAPEVDVLGVEREIEERELKGEVSGPGPDEVPRMHGS